MQVGVGEWLSVRVHGWERLSPRAPRPRTCAQANKPNKLSPRAPRPKARELKLSKLLPVDGDRELKLNNHPRARPAREVPSLAAAPGALWSVGGGAGHSKEQMPFRKKKQP
eukprot:gene14319-biopygen14172